MKKLVIFSLSVIAIHNTLSAANIPWWEQPTVCKLDSTNCYPSMGAGYERDMWDMSGNCRGVKLICADALTNGGDTAKPTERKQIERGININSDFDTNQLNLNDNCFGVRKTSENGSMAMLGGKYVNVWCRGVLNTNDIIEMPTGEITTGRQPTCESLAANGFIAEINDRCWGKRYNDDYRIECGNGLTAKRLVKLNGAEFDNRATNAPADQAAANRIFDQMESVARVARADKFGKKE